MLMKHVDKLRACISTLYSDMIETCFHQHHTEKGRNVRCCE